MEVVYERCCGLDVHKKTVVARAVGGSGKETRTFGTMTRDLLALGDWLVEGGVSHVAMESTGVYWKPVYNLLEGLGMTVLVVNAHHIKAVPGRKTDVKDAEWIADLLQHGLVRGSYIPDRAQRAAVTGRSLWGRIRRSRPSPLGWQEQSRASGAFGVASGLRGRRHERGGLRPQDRRSRCQVRLASGRNPTSAGADNRGRLGSRVLPGGIA